MSPAPAPRAFGAADLAEFRARLTELQRQFAAAAPAPRYAAFTDGACLGNPAGPGGWAAAHFPVADGMDTDSLPGDLSQTALLYGHLSSTTNNRAEALGVLAALKWTPPAARLILHSDSELTVNILKRVYRAKANPEIWQVIFETLADRRVELHPHWVRGHAGNPGNELADRLSQYGALDRPVEALADLFVGEPAEAPPPRRSTSEPPELAGLVPQGAWEKDFLRSIAQQLRARRALSPKQQAIVDRIRGRQ